MSTDVRAVFTTSKLSEDPKHSNVYALILDQEGRLVHGFHGLSGRGEKRSDYKAEIAKGLAKLKLPEGKKPAKERPAVLPDLKGATPGAPAGVRIFVRLRDAKGGFGGGKPVVEVVPMKAEDWKALAFPEKARDVEAETLRSWLVQLYPPAIRTVDQKEPFREITGRLELEPAGGRHKVRKATQSRDNRRGDVTDKGTAPRCDS